MPRFALLEEDEEDAEELGPTMSGELSLDSCGGIGQSRYFFDEDRTDDDDDEDDSRGTGSPILNKWRKEPPIGQSTQQALLSARINTDTTPMKTLLKYAIQDASSASRKQNQRDYENGDGEPSIQDLNDAMDALAIIVRSVDSRQDDSDLPSLEPAPLPSAYIKLGAAEQQIRQEMLEEKRKFDKQHSDTRREIKALLQKAEQKQAKLMAAQHRREEEAAKAETLRLQELERQRKIAAEGEALAKAQQQQRLREEQRAAEKAAKEQAERAAARDYLGRAEKLVAQLKQLQESVEPFNKSKPMGRRRLEMKKIVNGKVNTLSEDADKIRTVAGDVAAAIKKAKEDDLQIQEQIKAGNGEYSPEMAKGKRYFVDLLCSKVIVRVQAEGFNGQRGDGFPLAHMLTMVSVEHKDVIPVLAAHVYTVCPTAIPRLPKIAQDATEDEVMETLGMLRGKDGNFETFERFLARTEGLVSIIANIMSSEPAEHNLFGGHQGAVKWLSRFLSELPEPPVSPLPLITAPVLDAFLTGAGHMLANTFPDEFKKCLEKIQTNCLPRLDEGAVGKPSATRLRKTLDGGFESFKTTLPSRALGELYHGSSATGTRKPISSAPGAAPPPGNGAMPQQQLNNPFGASPSASASPFGMATSNTAAPAKAPNPFGGGTHVANPFGVAQPPAQTTNSQPSPFSSNPSPFGLANQPETSESMLSDKMNTTAANKNTSTASPSPFGGGTGGFGSAAPTPMGGSLGAATPSVTPNVPSSQPSFGAPVCGNSTFGASPFGAPAAQTTPFGGSSAPPSTSPFGAPIASPFGSANPLNSATPFASTPSTGASPFGGGPSSTTPFGGGVPASNPSPFSSTAGPASSLGASNPSPFGVAPNANPSPFGNSSAPPPSASPFATFSNQAPSPSPFGGGFGAAPPSNTNSTFGSQTPQQVFGSQPSPFGAPAASNSSPFGSPPPAATPFGGGGGSFGSSVPDNRPPCKFFARGQCRYGNNCKFSHQIPSSSSGATGGNSFSNPFGGGPRR